MPIWLEVALVGLLVGTLFGLFGVGGSSFATPALALIGVPGVIAVAAPLPATIPAAIAGMTTYIRKSQIEWRVARWSIYGGFPATVIGAVTSQYLSGRALFIASGIVLIAVGIRILLPLPIENSVAGIARRRAAVVIPAAAAVGFLTGLLANGGGFLLVPLFVVVLGLSMPEAAGTSLVVIAALSIPTLFTHWALGHIDWSVAVPFAAGSIPGAAAGSRIAQHIPAETMKRTFGILLIVFAMYFIFRQLV